MRDEGSMRVLLFQCRRDEEARVREYASFLRTSGLSTNELVAVDVTHGGLAAGVLDGADGAIIGGSLWAPFENVPGLVEFRRVLDDVKERNLPLLGVCFGAQLLAHHFGGEVVREQDRNELGTFIVRMTDDAGGDPIFAGLPREFDVQQAHRDRIEKLPDGAVLLASSTRCPVQAFVMPGSPVYGVQFHPERSVEDLEWGLRNLPQRNYSPEDVAAALMTLRPSTDAERVLTGFLSRLVRRG